MNPAIGSPQDESIEGNRLEADDFEQMVTEYLNRIVLPPQNSGVKFILCPIGLVGSGKTTVLKPIAQRLGLARVSGDEIRLLLKEQGFNWTRTIEIAFRVIQVLVEKGYSIAIDSDCSGPNVIETIEKMAAEHGYKVRFIHINPPEAFILNKLKNFRHTWLFKNADDALQSYYRRKPLHENLNLDFVYTFDTSKSDLPNQIEEVIFLLRER
ncbi:MAG: AAA family ATPase [Patescibacteria group bacterium]